MDNKNRATMSGKTRMVVRCWALTCLVLSLFATGSWASDPVKIGTLLADASTYNMRLVTVEGVVRNHQLEHFVGNVSGMEKCYQYFDVADETGAVYVAHLSICKVGNQTVEILQDGDHVTVDGHFAGTTGGSALLTARSIRKTSR